MAKLTGGARNTDASACTKPVNAAKAQTVPLKVDPQDPHLEPPTQAPAQTIKAPLQPSEFPLPL